jgi:predicted DCC family thiol-disulfide oxidoreductase YuxK
LTGRPEDRAEITVLYDEECGFCKACMGLLLVWDRRHRIYAVGIQSSEGQSLLSPLTDAEKLASAHLVTATGELISGARGAPTLLRQLPGARWLARLSEVTMPLVEATYRGVTRTRTFFGRFVSSGCSARADQRISERRRGTMPPTAAR